MSYQAIVAIVVVVGVLAGILLLILAWRRMPSSARGQRGTGETTALGMSIGMLFGAALGTIVWLSTDQFVFWVIFMGGGMTLGMAIGQARANGSR